MDLAPSSRCKMVEAPWGGDGWNQECLFRLTEVLFEVSHYRSWVYVEFHNVAIGNRCLKQFLVGWQGYTLENNIDGAHSCIYK